MWILFCCTFLSIECTDNFCQPVCDISLHDLIYQKIVTYQRCFFIYKFLYTFILSDTKKQNRFSNKLLPALSSWNIWTSVNAQNIIIHIQTCPQSVVAVQTTVRSYKETQNTVLNIDCFSTFSTILFQHSYSYICVEKS